jgi:phosphoribosylamine--glycine ligase
MVTAEGPRVLEFNARLGDPETQVLLTRLQVDLADLMLAALAGKLGGYELRWDPRSALCVVLASEGYPTSSRKGDPITGLDAAGRVQDVTVFHAGTRAQAGQVLVNGGRVLGVTGMGADLHAAHDRAYAAVDTIRWPGMQCRRDIGWRAL